MLQDPKRRVGGNKILEPWSQVYCTPCMNNEGMYWRFVKGRGGEGNGDVSGEFVCVCVCMVGMDRKKKKEEGKK